MHDLKSIEQELKHRQWLREKPFPQFLLTQFWQNVRNQTLERVKSCEVCQNTENLQAYHKTYVNRGWEDKHPEELMVLCQNCHKKAPGVVENPKNGDKINQQNRRNKLTEPHFGGGEVTSCRPMTADELQLFREYRALQGRPLLEPIKLSPAFHSYWELKESRTPH